MHNTIRIETIVLITDSNTYGVSSASSGCEDPCRTFGPFVLGTESTMTENRDSPIDDEAEFEKRLHELLLSAHEGGVSVEGGWSCVNTGNTPDWDVEIFRLKKNYGNNPTASNEK